MNITDKINYRPLEPWSAGETDNKPVRESVTSARFVVYAMKEKRATEGMEGLGDL